MLKNWRNICEGKAKLLLMELNKSVNPLTPMSDQDRIYPYNINTISTR